MAQIVTRGSRLLVRSGPEQSYPVVGYRNNGDTVVVAERRRGWCRIGTGQWVSCDFVRDAGAAPDPDTEDAVIAHPRRPASAHWKVLIGFSTNSAQLRDSHRAWLRGFASSQARAGHHVWIRGMASRLGSPERNRVLSEQRARAVRDYLVDRCGVPAAQITGVRGIGTLWARGSETEDDARSRAVEVIITNNVIELPGSFIQGQSPISSTFWIKYMGHGSGGEVVGGDLALFLVRTDQDYWQRYHYEGAGGTVGAPVSWGEALPPGQGWVRFTTRTPMSASDFVGFASLAQAGAQAGPVGVGSFELNLNHIKKVRLPTGSGFSLGVSETVGRMSTAGDLEHGTGWRRY